MSSNNNNITLNNYEEYFILYMDNELTAEGRQAVDDFIILHPHLAEELDVLMNTRLPLDEHFYFNKAELLAQSMKMNVVDEALLLYIDNELKGTEKLAVEHKISQDKDYAFQFSLLMKAKMDATEVVAYPNKKDLYRRVEKVRPFPLWMRVAAAVVLLLSGSLFFLLNPGRQQVDPKVALHEEPSPSPSPKQHIPEQNRAAPVQQNDMPLVAKTIQEKKSVPESKKLVEDNRTSAQTNEVATRIVSERKAEAIKLDVSPVINGPAIVPPLAVNKKIAYNVVTNKPDSSYNNQNNPIHTPDTDWAVATEKKTPAKGFLRKISRFIERNTGIATANADNELLVGAVALKLK